MSEKNGKSSVYENVAVAAEEKFEMEENHCYTIQRYPAVAQMQECKPNKSESLKKQVRLLTIIVAVMVVAVIAFISCILAVYVEFYKLKEEFVSFGQTQSELSSTIQNSSSYMKISELKEEFVSFQQTQSELSSATQKNTDSIFNSLNNSIDKLHQSQIAQAELLHNTTEDIKYTLIGLYPSSAAFSCAAILLIAPSFPSGYYWVKSSNGSAVRVYCDMTRSCGNITRGWMRVANLDMKDNTNIQCPTDLCLDSTIQRTCRICNTSASCSSNTYSTVIAYSRVCGRMTAYQVGTPNAFFDSLIENLTISTHYVDGVSLTHGNPRQHIWTFAAALNENDYFPTGCPCNDSNSYHPEFVGNDYFCDTVAMRGLNYTAFFADDPLWDGADCVSQNACCTFNNPPWFYKQLQQPTTEDIEMRVCRDQNREMKILPLKL